MKLKSGEDWHPTEEMIEGWKSAYKKVDVEQELKKMSVWCEANPAKRKTKAGSNTFCNKWLSAAESQGGNSGDVSKYRSQNDQKRQPASDSIKARTIEMDIVDVAWIACPQEKQAQREYYKTTRGFYFEGEFKNV